jgi:hypothetical protein
MAHQSLLDIQSEQPDDGPSSPAEKSATMNELSTTVEIIRSNYQLTWRMAGFSALLLSAGFAFARFLKPWQRRNHSLR